jgi:cytoskeleton protein RodZ
VEQQPDINNTDPVDATATPPALSLGSMLREARERQDLSIGDVANQIKFAPRQIEALEADDFKLMSETAFLRGFVRSYGKFLQLNIETLFAVLPETKKETLSAASVANLAEFPNAQTARRQNLIWMSAALLFVVIALGFAIATMISPVNPSKEAPVETAVMLPNNLATVAEQSVEPVAAASAVALVVPAADAVVAQADVVAQEKQNVSKPVVAPQTQSQKPVDKPVGVAQPPVLQTTAKPAGVTESTSAKATIPIDTLLGTQPAKPTVATVAVSETSAQSTGLHIVFGHESWTEIKDKHGKILSSQVNAGGSELHLDGQAPYTMLIGHAQSARLYYKGKQVDLTPYINKYSEVAHVTLE